ncbi:unnamed protein product [Cuscuta campestris]|uniref:Uncharacterized protein n=1 Tax=Cuscuta campestris TaxID=132261 RepID=A0A484MPA0_9ASTE|nr:unnamed protein product [Cuscuta campestris]
MSQVLSLSVSEDEHPKKVSLEAIGAAGHKMGAGGEVKCVIGTNSLALAERREGLARGSLEKGGMVFSSWGQTSNLNKVEEMYIEVSVGVGVEKAQMKALSMKGAGGGVALERCLSTSSNLELKDVKP